MLLFSRDKSPQDECLRSRSVPIARPDLIHSHGTEVIRLGQGKRQVRKEATSTSRPGGPTEWRMRWSERIK